MVAFNYKQRPAFWDLSEIVSWVMPTITTYLTRWTLLDDERLYYAELYKAWTLRTLYMCAGFETQFPLLN